MRYAIDRQNSVLNRFSTEAKQSVNPIVTECIERTSELKKVAEIENEKRKKMYEANGYDMNARYTPNSIVLETSPIVKALSVSHKVTKNDTFEKMGTFKHVTVKGWNPNLKTKFSFENYIPSLLIASAIMRGFRKIAKEINLIKNKAERQEAIKNFEELTTPKNATQIAKMLEKALNSGKILKDEFNYQLTKDYTNS